jgi:hypothetical protein
MNPRTLKMVTASLLATAIVIGTEFSFKTNNATAQMMQPGMMGPGMMAGNMTSGMMQPGMMGMGNGMMDGRNMMGMGPGMMGPGMMGPGMMGPGMMGPGMMAGNQSMMTQMMEASQNITGSIKLLPVITNAITSQVNVTLSQAVTAAESAVGNNSRAVAAHIGEANGYLTYCIWVMSPDMRVNMVIIDPGNGQVLSNKEISLQHPMMGMGMMMQPGMMGMGPGMMGMGPGMMGMGPGMMGMGPGMMGMGPGMMG